LSTKEAKGEEEYLHPFGKVIIKEAQIESFPLGGILTTYVY